MGDEIYDKNIPEDEIPYWRCMYEGEGKLPCETENIEDCSECPHSAFLTDKDLTFMETEEYKEYSKDWNK